MARAGIWVVRKQSSGLTREELDAAPVVVDIQAGYSNSDPLFVGWNGSQQVTVSGTVHVSTQGGQTVATTGDWLTDDELRASAVAVEDDYQTGEILPDQTAVGGVLTFTFSAAVQNIWVYAVRPLALDDLGEVRVDPFGGTPSASLGIPVALGGITPIPTTATVVRVFAPAGVRVTVYGNRRS